MLRWAMPFRAAKSREHLLDRGRRRAVALLVIVVEAVAVLLAAQACLAQHVAQVVGAVRLVADPSRCRARRGRPSGTAPSGNRNRAAPGRSSAGLAPSSISALACRWRGSSMRLPMKPWQTPATTATLRIFLESAIAVASTRGLVLAPRTISEQLHHIGRREEVQADHVLRPLRAGGDLVDIEIGGVGGEDRARLHDARRAW